MYFRIRKSPTSGQYFWAAFGDNGETLGHGEQHPYKSTAQNAVNVISREAAGARVIDDTGE